MIGRLSGEAGHQVDNHNLTYFVCFVFNLWYCIVLALLAQYNFKSSSKMMLWEERDVTRPLLALSYRRSKVPRCCLLATKAGWWLHHGWYCKYFLAEGVCVHVKLIIPLSPEIKEHPIERMMCGLVVECLLWDWWVVGSILGWTIPKTVKMVPISSLLDTVFRVGLGRLDHPMIPMRGTAAHRSLRGCWGKCGDWYVIFGTVTFIGT